MSAPRQRRAGQKPLTLKQQLFVEEYLVDLNASQAAIRAGYSKKTAASQAYDLLRKPEIQNTIAAAFEERVDRVQVSQDAVVRELMAVAFTSLTDIASWGEDGELQLVPSGELSPAAAAALKELRSAKATVTFGEHTRTTVRRALKLHDKIRALELLGRHLGMFVDHRKVEHSGSVGLTLSQLVALVEGDGEDGNS